jgi:uncharacterized protein YjbI with pentapeptide repeats
MQKQRFTQDFVDRDRKYRDEKEHQAAAHQKQLSQLKPPQMWIPLSLLAAMVLFLILFKVEGQPFQWKVGAREWAGFGQSYDEDALTVTEKGAETTNASKEEPTKTTTITKRLQPAKTLWDWMSLLLTPATLAGLGFLFQSSQEKAQRRKDEADKERDRKKDEADKERDINQQREQALQTYLNYLSELPVDKQLKKQALEAANTSTQKGTVESDATEVETEAAKAKSETTIDAKVASKVVKARTLALLRMFDEDIPRKTIVLSFLADADLLSQLDLDLTFIGLNGANLKKVNFSACELRSANLNSAHLSRADFSGANLRCANLSRADLNDADLSGATLWRTDLSSATLWRTNLSGANLSRADLRDAFLRDADLSGANLSSVSDVNLGDIFLLGANLSGANLWRTNLSDANLKDAKFNGAFLQDANLSGANLSRANLSGANLSGADLRLAFFWDTSLSGVALDRDKKDAVARIQSAENWQEARYSPEMRELLGLPLETSDAAQD